MIRIYCSMTAVAAIGISPKYAVILSHSWSVRGVFDVNKEMMVTGTCE